MTVSLLTTFTRIFRDQYGVKPLVARGRFAVPFFTSVLVKAYRFMYINTQTGQGILRKPFSFLVLRGKNSRNIFWPDHNVITII